MQRRRFFRALSLGICLACSLSRPADAQGQGTGSAFLYLQVSIKGTGSDPVLDPDVANAEQSWNYERSILALIEMTVASEQGNAPSSEILAFSPKLGGVVQFNGSLADHVSNQYRDFGEGGSWVDYSAVEDWSSNPYFSDPNLANHLTFYLEADAKRWTAELDTARWLDSLASAPVTYSAESHWKPNGESTGCDFYTFDEETRSAPATDDCPAGKAIATGYHPGGTSPGFFEPQLLLVGVPATVAQGVYTGSTNLPLPKPENAKGSWKMTYEVSWTIRETLPDVELIVRAPDYNQWRPTAEPGPKHGKPLKLIAKIESPVGADLSRVRVEKFDWKLVNTSREPGIAVNFPADSTDTTPDLRLANIPTRNDGQEATQLNPPALSSVAYIEPYDWGGWTILNVQATLNDGRVVKGKLKVADPDSGPPEDIHIPKSEKDRKVALAWLRDHGATEMDDAEDSDKLPKGKPGADGDGLSVYEEYRGFYAQGRHISTDPRRKDLFIWNDTQGSPDAYPIAERAIDRFGSISRLAVHKILTNERSKQIRAINHNRAQGPTKGNQAWVELVASGRSTRPNDTIKPGSRPRTTGLIRVPDWSANIADAVPLFDRRGSPPASLGLEHMLVQALFQSVSVDRPGPSDKVGTFRFWPGDPGAGIKPYFELGPNKVAVIDFFGRNLAEQLAAQINQAVERSTQPLEGETPAETQDRSAKQRARLTTFKWLIGEKGRAHSGPEECLMRDWFADVYRSAFTSVDGLPLYRLVDRDRGAEKPGSQLGSTRQGTGVNDPNRQPEPRYGNSSVSTPADQQMVVSDSAP